MLRPKRQFYAAPKVVIFGNGTWIVVQDAEITVVDALTNQHPHALEGERLVFIINANAKNQFR